MDYGIKQKDKEYRYKVQNPNKIHTTRAKHSVDVAGTSMLVGDKGKAGYTEEMEPDTGTWMRYITQTQSHEGMKHKGVLSLGTPQCSAHPGDCENSHEGVQLTATLAAASSWIFLDLQAEHPSWKTVFWCAFNFKNVTVLWCITEELNFKGSAWAKDIFFCRKKASFLSYWRIFSPERGTTYKLLCAFLQWFKKGMTMYTLLKPYRIRGYLVICSLPLSSNMCAPAAGTWHISTAVALFSLHTCSTHPDAFSVVDGHTQTPKNVHFQKLKFDPCFSQWLHV